MFLAEFQQPVSNLKGISKQLSSKFSVLEIVTICDLLRYFPRGYEDRKNIKPLSTAFEQDSFACVVTVTGHHYVGSYSKQTLVIDIADESEKAELSCFGRNFLSRKLTIGQQFFVWGKFSLYQNQIQCSQFLFEPYTETPIDFGRIDAVYRTVKGLSQNRLRDAIAQAITLYGSFVNSELPLSVQNKYQLLDHKNAIKAIHQPSNQEQIRKARHSLIYQELFHLQWAILQKKNTVNYCERPYSKLPLADLDTFKESLPFELTPGQNNALSEILADLETPKPLNRLLQGDVGSGKTLVAFCAAIPLIRSHLQVVLMVPTELLAIQHFKKANEQLTPMNISIDLLTGNQRASQRRAALERLASGESEFIIGTHALFSEDVHYSNLGLVIIDEQHRFGVEQRQLLQQKAHYPDLLVMTATPIPRSLAMTAYGDLDISSIDTLPKGRVPIQTYLSIQGKEEKVYSFVSRELNKGYQAYFIYPMIQATDNIGLRDAHTMYENLKKIFPGISIGLVHSQLNSEEKDQTMNKFSQGELQILVATTVVEVGVDVPNANIIVIDNAERFGLSALHQLRGRVGRSDIPSYAFLVCHPDLSDEGKQRLKTIRNSNDGFEIAQRDLDIRGPGDLSGNNQAGFLRLNIAHLVRHQKILYMAREDVLVLQNKDPTLQQEENTLFKKLFEQFPPFNEDLIALN